MLTDEPSSAQRREFLTGLAKTVTGAGLLTTGALALDATSAAAATTDTVYDKGGAVFNIAAYGASPTATSAVNTQAIKDALLAAKTAGGGVVWVPQGVYPCGIFALLAGVIIDGAGTLKYTSTSSSAAWISAASTAPNCGIRNIVLDGNNSAVIGSVLLLKNMSGLTLQGVTILNAGGSTSAAWLQNVSNGRIDRLAVVGAASSGISVQGTNMQIGSISAQKCNSARVGESGAIVLLLTDSTAAQVLAFDNNPPAAALGLSGVHIEASTNTSFGEITSARNGLTPNTHGNGLSVRNTAHCSFSSVSLQDNGYHGMYARNMNFCTFASVTIKRGADYPLGLFESSDNTFASVSALVSEFATEGVILIRQANEPGACDRNTFGQVNLTGEWNTAGKRGLLKPIVVSNAHDNVFGSILATGAGAGVDATFGKPTAAENAAVAREMVFAVAVEAGSSRNQFSEITAIGDKAQVVDTATSRYSFGAYGVSLASTNVIRIDAGCKDNVVRDLPICSGDRGPSMTITDNGTGSRWGVRSPGAANGSAGKWYASPAAQTFVAQPNIASNYLQVSPITFARPVTLQRIGMRIAAAAVGASKFRFGIYADNNGRPGSLIFDSGKGGSTLGTHLIDGTKASSSIVSLPCTASLLPGTYWIGYVHQGEPGTRPAVLRHYGHTGAIEIRESEPDSLACAYEQAGVTGALPDTFTATPTIPFDCVRTFVQVAS